MTEPRICFEPFADSAIKEFIQSGVDFHNMATTGHAAWYPANFVLRGDRDEVLGGLVGQIWGLWLYVSFLWVAEPARGAGNATRLMRAAEDYAIERGCVGGYLTTYSFQAPGFYRKFGYEVVGTIDGFPPGHQFHLLSKKLG
jgi:GNAT superfamily N-acetyltransferase